MDPIQIASFALAGAILVWSYVRYRRGQLVKTVNPELVDVGTDGRIDAVDFYWRPG